MSRQEVLIQKSVRTRAVDHRRTKYLIKYKQKNRLNIVHLI